MQIKRENLNPCTVKLDVVCSPEQVREGFGRAYRELSKQFRVPGFRPGQAPQAVIRKMFPKEQIWDVAADEVVRVAIKDAVKQESLEPYDRPQVELTEFDEEAEKCVFTAKISLEPQVELGEYKGLSAEKPTVEVTKEDIESQLEELRRRHGKRQAVEGRSAQEGDIAVVNVKADGEDGEGRNFMTVIGKTFPQLDQALGGMNVEEMKVLDLNFPDTFQEKDWAGKLLKCQVTLRSLSSMVLPELDDEFAKSLKADNLDTLKEKLLERIAEAKENMSRDYVYEQLQEEILKNSTISVPDAMWENVATQRLKDIEQECSRQGKTLEQYAKENGMDQEQLVDAWRNEAKREVLRAVAIRKIFEKEELKLLQGELDYEIISILVENGISEAEAKRFLKDHAPQVRQEAIHRAIYKKVMGFLMEHATVTPLKEN